MHLFDDPITNDITLPKTSEGLNRPAIASWNSTLFVVGAQYLHSIQITSLQTKGMWNSSKYNYINLQGTIDTQYSMEYISFTQYKSSLYILTSYVVPSADLIINADTVLLRFDLNTPDPASTKSTIEVNRFIDGEELIYYSNSQSKACVVVGDKTIYVVTETYVAIYHEDSDTWSRSKASMDNTCKSEFGDRAISCALTIDQQYIYIFAPYDKSITKYVIDENKFIRLNNPNICWTNVEIYPITAPDGKIYIHGCYIKSWKTAIFNPDLDAFEDFSIGIQYPSSIAQHRRSQLTVFDDNILLLYSLWGTVDLFLRWGYVGIDHLFSAPNINFTLGEFDPFSSLYFAITHLVSINFAATITTIWPSEGIRFKYYLNDFNENKFQLYPVNIVSDDLGVFINETLTMQPTKNECVCEGYRCQDCDYYYNLSQFISTTDYAIGLVTLSIQSELEDILIIPDEISIQLQRCHVTFDIINSVTNIGNPMIQFEFSYATDNCYSHHNPWFTVAIWSEIAKINQELVMYAGIKRVNNVWLCDYGYFSLDDCVNFTNNTFELFHDKLNSDLTNSVIQFTSEMIDLALDGKTLFEVQYLPESEEALSVIYVAIGSSFGVFILVLCLICGWKRFQYNKARIINNALVLIIGISRFDKETLLSGVPNCVQTLMDLWKNTYKYHDIIVCNSDTLYCTKDDIIDFIDNNVAKLKENTYECIMVHVISHGKGDGKEFITSDSKTMGLGFIKHEINDAVNDASVIKVIWSHTCRGQADGVFDGRGKIEGDGMTIGEQSNQGDEIKESVADMARGTGDNNDSAKDANWAIIWGNIEGRKVSDSSYFAKCICDEFENNANKMWILKEKFRSMITRIRNNLIKETDGGHIAENTITLLDQAIIFKPFNGSQNDDLSDVGRTQMFANVSTHSQRNTDLVELAPMNKNGNIDIPPVIDANQITFGDEDNKQEESTTVNTKEEVECDTMLDKMDAV